MGICSSCLGIGRRSDSTRSDSSNLLGDAYQPHYGSINRPGSHNGRQADPEEIRRQRDALERICAQTSDKLIPVSQATYAEDGSKMASEYPRLFNERFPPSKGLSGGPASGNASQNGDDDEDEEADEATWLGAIAGNTTEPEGAWERVEPIESDLTIHFGEPLGPDRRPAR